jgi:hypothetical protein
MTRGGVKVKVPGLGSRLPAFDINVLTFSPRGIRPSGGTFTYANALDDVAAALRWLRGTEGRRLGVDPAGVALGGVYAAALRQRLNGDRAPGGNVQFDPEALIQDIVEHEADYGHVENASRLADRCPGLPHPRVADTAASARKVAEGVGCSPRAVRRGAPAGCRRLLRGG